MVIRWNGNCRRSVDGLPFFFALGTRGPREGAVMTDKHLRFHCVCGWTNHSLPTDEWRCPRCGDALGATAVMAAEEAAVDERPEFVFSPSQRRHTWPPDFWVGIMHRVLDDELTISPRELARGVLPYVRAAGAR
jgi:hypothetical protein